jgi:hypothetical protein
MTFSMDLNASPLPEEDEQPYEEPVEVDYAQEEHVESAVETLRRVCNASSGYNFPFAVNWSLWILYYLMLLNVSFL